MAKMDRCQWCNKTDSMKEYHDKEWGVPLRDDIKLFEFLILDGFQAGLSWQTIINKRENFRVAFDNFDPLKISEYGELKIIELMNNSGIIRNSLKIQSAIVNARSYLEIEAQFGSFSKFIWQFTDNLTIHNQYSSYREIPTTSIQSDQMSKELRRFGFKFVGSTICYAFMQAAGLVNDHEISCFRYQEVLILSNPTSTSANLN